MNIIPREYRDASDLQKMRAVLQAGCADPGTPAYYAHPGDLNWWLFNWLDGQHPWQCIQLWDAADNPGQLLGWGLCMPWGAFDVFVRPELCGSAWADEINNQVEARTAEAGRAQGLSHILRMNVAETDNHLRKHLVGRGFEHVPEDMLAMRLSLEHELPTPGLPGGFTLLPVDETIAASRAEAQHAAFRSGTPVDEYARRYGHFMSSPGYPASCDWAVVAPGGRVAAFCIVWPDAASGTGQIEPVGTHPDFQGMGLGKAAMWAGLRHLQEQGMHTARICVLSDNPAAIRLYEGVGFRTVNKLLLHRKAL